MQQSVLANGMQKGVVAEFGNVELVLLCPYVQGFYVFHDIVEGDAVGIYKAVYHGIEDEGIIGAGAESECKFHCDVKSR